jgi:hypothetical protein
LGPVPSGLFVVQLELNYQATGAGTAGFAATMGSSGSATLEGFLAGRSLIGRGNDDVEGYAGEYTISCVAGTPGRFVVPVGEFVATGSLFVVTRMVWSGATFTFQCVIAVRTAFVASDFLGAKLAAGG